MTRTYRTGRHWAADAPVQHPGPLEGCPECTETKDARVGQPELICAFALHRGKFCQRPAGHEATDGRVARHDSTPSQRGER